MSKHPKNLTRQHDEPTTPIDELDLIPDTEAAELLDVSVKTMRNWRGSGKGPPFLKLEGAVRYSRADLIAWCKARRRRSTSDKGGGDA